MQLSSLNLRRKPHSIPKPFAKSSPRNFPELFLDEGQSSPTSPYLASLAHLRIAHSFRMNLTPTTSAPFAAVTASSGAANSAKRPSRWQPARLTAFIGLWLTLGTFLAPQLSPNAAAQALNVTLGTQVLNTTNNPNIFPNVYSTGYWGAKHQVLILASELINQGMGPGNLTRLEMYIDSIGLVDTQANFQISISHTALTALTGIQTVASTSVYGPLLYTQQVGTNTHTFTTPFNWNGTDNLLVEICFNNTDWDQPVAQTFYTVTPFNSVAFFRQDALTVCASTTTSGTSNQRPTLTLRGQTATTDLIPPVITSLTTSNNLGCTPASRLISATATDNVGVVSVALTYNVNGGSNVTLPMTLATGTWTATIPVQAAGAQVNYYAIATDLAGNITTLATAPAGQYTDAGSAPTLVDTVSIIAGDTAFISAFAQNGSQLKISEWLAAATFGGAVTGAQATLPAAIDPASDELFEITNNGAPISLSGYSLSLYYTTGGGPGGPTAQTLTFTFPSGYVLGTGQVAIIGTGSHNDDPANGVFYFQNGADNVFNSGALFGLVLRNAANNIVDAAAASGYVFPAGAAVPTSEWSGNVASGQGIAGARRTAETNTAADWLLATVAVPTQLGTPWGTPIAFAYSTAITGGTTVSTSATLNVSPATDSKYYLTTTAGVCTYIDSVYVNVNTYCVAEADTSQLAYLNRVAFNSAFAQQPLNPAVTYSLAPQTVVLARGQNVDYSFEPAFPGIPTNVWMRAYADWNRDGDFTDPGESVANSGLTNSTYANNFTVPATAGLGATRIRVVLRVGVSPSACGTFPDGEVEDFRVFVVDPAADAQNPAVASVNQIANACAPSARTITATFSDDQGIASADLTYTLDNGATLQSAPFSFNLHTGAWEATLPAGQSGVAVQYFATAQDLAGNASPASGIFAFTDGYLLVNAGVDVIIPPGANVTRSATAALPVIRITELLANRATGAGVQASFNSSFPTNTAQDMVEMTNLGNVTVDLTGYTLNISGPAPVSYAFPAGLTLAPNAVLTLVSGAGTDDAASNIYFANNGTDNVLFFNGAGAAIALQDAQGAVVDAVAYNNQAFPAGSPVTTADYTGNVNIGTGGALVRTGADNNTAANWTPSSATNVSSLGSLNTGLVSVNASSRWFVGATLVDSTGILNVNPLVTTTYRVVISDGVCSATDSFLVTVDTNLVDLEAVAVFPAGALICNLDTESVFVRIKNVGAADAALNGVIVRLRRNGLFAGQVTLPASAGTLLVGDSLDVPFTVFLGATILTPVTYSLQGIVKHPLDPITGNDTSNAFIVNSYDLAADAGPDQFIALGSSTTLSVQTNTQSILITEVMTSRGLTGTQATFPTWYPATNADEAIEITNTGTSPVNLTGWVLQSLGAGGGPGGGASNWTDTLPAITLNPGQQLLMLPDSGASQPANGLYYTQIQSNGNVYTSGTGYGFILRRANGGIADVVGTNGFTFPAQLPAGNWSGNIPSALNTAGVKRLGVDNNLASDWGIASVAAPTNIGAYTTIGGLTATWTTLAGATVGTGAVTVTPTTNTTYVVTVTNPSGCTVLDTVTVNVIAQLQDLVLLRARPVGPACSWTAANDFEYTVTNTGNALINFAVNPATLELSANLANYSQVINTGTLPAGDTIVLTLNGVNLAGGINGTTNTYVLSGRVVLSVDPDSLDNDFGPLTASSTQLYITAGNDTTINAGGTATLLARGAESQILISEIMQLAGTSATSGSQTFYPSPLVNTANGADMVELTNAGPMPVSLAGYVLRMYTGAGPTLDTIVYTLPAQARLEPQQVLVVVLSPGTDDVAKQIFFTGTGAVGTSTFLSATAVGYTLRRPGGVLVDAVATNNYAFPVLAGVQATDWSGNTGNGQGRASHIRKGRDRNIAADWSLSQTTDTSSIGYLNPGLLRSRTQINWLTATGTVIDSSYTVTVNPTQPSYYIAELTNGLCVTYDTVSVGIAGQSVDLTVSTLTPPNGFNLTQATTPVSVYVKNIGTATVSNAVVGFASPTLNTTGTLTQPLAPGDSILFTFSGGLGAQAQTGCAYVQAPLDINTGNDTICGTYTSSIVADIGVDTFLNNLSTLYSTPTPITVRVRNYGTLTVNGFSAELKVNGATVATETATLTIAPGQSLFYTFQSFWTPGTVAGLQQLCASATVPGDANLANDEKCDSFQVLSAEGSLLASLNGAVLFPNPVVGSTEATLGLTLGSPARVSVQVVDAAGRVVSSINAGQLTAGEQRLQLNTANLAQGLYQVQVRAGDATRTLRMSVIR